MAQSRIKYGNPHCDVVPDEEITHIRIYKEDEWTMDGADDNGNYSGSCWTYDSWQDAMNDLSDFRTTFFPR